MSKPKKSSSLHSFMFLTVFMSMLCFSTTTTTRAQKECSRTGCKPGAPEIRFPFRLNRTQPERCGYPGFDLSCNARGQTIIDLPVAGEFAVDSVDYGSGTVRVSDPGNCMAGRLLRGDFRVGSNFVVQGMMVDFVFLNCTRNVSGSDFLPVSCLSGEGYAVGAVFGAFYNGLGERPCSVISTVQVPMMYPTLTGFQGVALTWVKPDCSGCEARGGTCGLRGDTGLRVGCVFEPGSSSSKNGLPRGAKYGIVIGVGIPGFLIAIGVVFHLSGKMAAGARRRRHVSTMMSTSVAPNPMVIRMGLDRPTIESYPKTMLGQSKRLPNPGDDTCPICLSDYQPSEALRTIPDCKHYFHVDCIDEWLRLNGTCPMCRKSPEGSSVFTTSSSSSSSTSHR